MKNYKIKELENIFECLVEYANVKEENKKNIIVPTDKSIDFIYKKIGIYCMSKNIRLSGSYLNAYVHVIYNNEKYGEKIYRIFCPYYGRKEFYIPDNINTVDCPVVNFEDVINYYKKENKKEQLKNIKNSINELIEQGVPLEEINNYIENILYNEKENPKQKVKRPQK